jgi:hypothetical protein
MNAILGYFNNIASCIGGLCHIDTDGVGLPGIESFPTQMWPGVAASRGRKSLRRGLQETYFSCDALAKRRVIWVIVRSQRPATLGPGQRAQ